MNNQVKLQTAFKAAFKKLAVLGHDINNMVDCSEVIPEPPNVKIKAATFPAGQTNADVEQAVSIQYLPHGARLLMSTLTHSAPPLPSPLLLLTPARLPPWPLCKHR